MNLDSFLRHYQLRANPFDAEEARHDPVFERLVDAGSNHPDFGKIVGRLDKPSTAVLFGEKGSGKTAMRLLIGRALDRHNQAEPDRRVLVVAYDDFNPVLDNLARKLRRDGTQMLDSFRLEDHQDAILSRAVTKFVNALLGESADADAREPMRLPEPSALDQTIKSMPRQSRIDLAVLAALYDQTPTGPFERRWQKLRSRLRLRWRPTLRLAQHAATGLTVVAVALAIAVAAMGTEPAWLPVALGLSVAGAALMWGFWGWRQLRVWRMARRTAREIRVVDRSAGELRRLLGELAPNDLQHQPLPDDRREKNDHSASDARYQLTRRLLDLLHRFGHIGIVVLVDRVDEPNLVSGDPDRMRALIWPLLENKFLQQEAVGLKLLLPIELRHHLMRETSQFFQEARLDKQHFIDRLTWPGTTLYDLCTARLNACRTADGGGERSDANSGNDGNDESKPEPISLMNLFQEDVSREAVIDALDQMHQPRDAFKFLYSLIQEHCRLVPEEQQSFKIARLTLDSVRKTQSQRVQEFYRGFSPA